MSITADQIINLVRDMIPDPIYTAGTDTPLPNTDGNLYRTITLLNWIDRATKRTARKVDWVIEDWYAFAQVASQPDYALDAKWLNLEIPAYANQWPLRFIPEQYLVYPQTATAAQPIAWGLHRRTDHLEIALFPTPNTADASTTINQGGGLSSTSLGPLVLTSVTGFLTFGYVLIDTEILQYNTLTTSTKTITTLVRGQCGTTAASHANGATVQSLGAWIKGKRMPIDITATTSVVELPSAFITAMEYCVRVFAAEGQNDYQEAEYLNGKFEAECRDILDDPGWRQHQGIQIPAYGTQVIGPLAWGTTVLP